MIDPVLIVLMAVGVLLAVRDPRRLLPGVLLTFGVMAFASTLLRELVDAGALLTGFDAEVRDLILGWFTLLFPLIAGLGLGVFLFINGLTMIRKEQRSLANLLSLAMSLAIFGLFAAGGIAVAFSSVRFITAIIFLIPPIAYLGTGLFAYLGWSLVYAKIAKRIRDPQSVIVLGSGIKKDGTVTPLLAQRVELGVRFMKTWPAAIGVMSGGKGADEPRSEAEAMADHAIKLGAPKDRIVTERESRTTEENLHLSQRILTDRGAAGKTLVVTSSYHAFRAATLMRREGMSGHAVGAKTAAYYVPSALLREYLALLRDHKMLNIIALSITAIPGAVFVVGMLLN